MTGAVTGMGMINSEIVRINNRNGCETKIGPSIVDKLSSDTHLVSAQGFDNNDRDTLFGMNSSSRASSQTSTTEPFVDGYGEEDNDGAILDAATTTPASSGNQSERRNSEPMNSGRLRFTTLTIREYPRVLGDNVTVKGAPISLSWRHQDEKVFEIEEYEEAIQDTRRTQSELKMPSSHRDKILKDSGYSRKEIQEAIKNSNIARNQRRRTVETLKLQPLQEAFEKVVRVGKNPLRKSKKNRTERLAQSI